MHMSSSFQVRPAARHWMARIARYFERQTFSSVRVYHALGNLALVGSSHPSCTRDPEWTMRFVNTLLGYKMARLTESGSQRRPARVSGHRSQDEARPYSGLRPVRGQ